jgi:diguanylate cyclase (GGDEF)-like protein/PAS domain S-box-containing protein
MMKRARTDPVHYYRKILLTGFAALVLLSCVGMALMLVALELQANAQAYIAGESNWSKGVNGAIFHLDRYVETLEEPHLERAETALSIPLGGLAARNALERKPPDLETAREGFLQSNNKPEVVPGLILTYRYFRWVPFIEDAVAEWRSTDPQILRLREILTNLEQQGESISAATRSDLRAEITRLSLSLRSKAKRFSDEIMTGVMTLKRILMPLAVVGALFMALVAWWILYRMFNWLRARDRRFLATFEQAGMGMLQLDLEHNILDANPAFCSIVGMAREQLVAKPVSELVNPDDRADLENFDRQLLGGETRSYTTRRNLMRGDGSRVRAKLTSALTRTEQGRAEQFIWLVEDVTRAQELAEQLSYQASHDELTGLYNRREMERRIEVALEDARVEKSRHVLCFVDVDQFKVVNDTCGHVAGDQLLRRIVRVLQHQLRAIDVVGRLGGDEFAVILHYTELDDGRQVAEKLRRALAAEVFQWDERSFRLSASVGVSEITEHAPDVTWVLQAADTACHIAKDMGRDRVHVFEESDQAVAQHFSGLQWLGSIQRALDDDRLYLHVQRMESLSGAVADHYEILVRLMDENGLWHTPGAFLPAAERYGLASMVDMRVLETTLMTLNRHPHWLAEGGRCHINISGASVSNHDFHHFVLQLLQRYDVPGERLCLEITETAAMANLNDAWHFFEQVGAHGVSIALDDFGSGMSSFNYLRNLPADILKIDGAFVREMAFESRDYAVVRAINEVAKALGKTTVAEFVENRETRRLLRELGVDFAQGFAIHKPEPLDDLITRGALDRVAEPPPGGF